MKPLTLRELEELEAAARAKSSTGLGELHPELLFGMLDGAIAANDNYGQEALASALSSWTTRARDVWRECLEQRLQAMLFDRQREVCDLIDAGERYIALCCGRRAGKTKLLAQLLVRFAARAYPGQEVVFAGPTLKRAKELIWAELLSVIRVAGLAAEWLAQAGPGTVTTSHGVTIRLAGLNDLGDVQTFARGGNMAALFVDEASVSTRMLGPLLTAAGPALEQSGGVLVMAGTPEQVESGDWYDICQGAAGFVARNWYLGDNPHLGPMGQYIDPQEILRRVRERNGWTDTHPEYVTEYLGRWCTNPSLLCFELDPVKNLCDIPIQYDPRTWRHFIGIDYGFYPDPCAWVVLAAPSNRNEVYCIHSEVAERLDSSEIAAKTYELAQRYKPIAIVGDSASGGPVFMSDYNRKYGRGRANIQSADKYDKPAGISLINTELRLGRLKFTAATRHLYDKVAKLRWEDETRTRVLEGPQYPEDEADAWRYAFLRALVLFVAEEKAAENRHEQGIREANERAQAQIRYQRWLTRRAS